MKLAFKIFLSSLLFCACANNTEVTVPLTSSETEAKIQNHIDSLTDKAIAAEVDLSIEKEVKESPKTKVEKTPAYVEESTQPRKASTIAQQQEAARKIQNELANRNPQPNEDEVQKGAVFQKIISTPKPTAVSEKKETAIAEAPAKKPVKKEPIKKKTAKKKAYPAIEFEEIKMTFDTIAQGDVIDYKFVFTNTGNAPLEITGASATCGCTQPSFPFIPIEPNEQGHISVRYNSVGKEGFQNPEITVKTNINNKEIVLLMEGFVVKKEKEEKGK